MTVTAVFSAIMAILKAIPILNDWVAKFIAFYIDTANAKTKKDFVDAASASVSAKTQEDRFKAAELWQKALKNSRYE